MREPRACLHCKEVRLIKAWGYCAKCYARIRRHGTPEERSRKTTTICTHCGAPELAKGLCKKCYERKAKTGTPEYTKVKKRCVVEGCTNWRVSYGLCDKHRSRLKPSYKDDPASKDYHLKNKFGITLDDYETMLKTQKGVCAICGNPPKKIALAVDHCHETGKVRGLLCGKCNIALGGFNDSVPLLKFAIKYLETTCVPEQ